MTLIPLRRQDAADRSRRLRRARRAADRRHRDRAGSEHLVQLRAARRHEPDPDRRPLQHPGRQRHPCRSAAARRPGDGYPCLIGEDVLIGHMAMVHGCILHDRAFVGLGAIVMDGCEIEGDAMLAAGAMLTQGKRIPSGQLWAGRPAKYVRDLSEADLAGMRAGRRPLCRAGEAPRGARSAALSAPEPVDPLPAGAASDPSASAIAASSARWSAALVGRSARSRLSWSSSASGLGGLRPRAASSREIACCASTQLSEPCGAGARHRPLGGRESARRTPRRRPAPRRRRAAIRGLQAPHRRRTTGASRTGSSIAQILQLGRARRQRREGALRHAAGEQGSRARQKAGRTVHARSPRRAACARQHRPPPARAGGCAAPALPLCRRLPRARSSAG